MSGRLTPSDRKLLGVAGGVSLVLIIGTAVLTRGAANTDETPTTYSAGSGGAKAAYLLLLRTRYPVRRWEESMRRLPSGVNATLILADPRGAPTTEEREALKGFLERGGRVIATGVSGAFFLPEHRVIPDPVAGMTWKRLPSRSPSSVTRAAPDITLAPQAYWDSETFALGLYGDDKLRVVKYEIGQGDVIWWASPTPLTNAGIRETGNLEFFLACLGDAHRQIFWDEYFHGHRPAPSGSLAASSIKWIGLQVALVIVAVLATYSRRSGPIVAPAGDSRLSPLEFVRTLGSLYARARAASVAVDICYQRFRYQLTRRLGLASKASADELERAVRERWNVVDPAFGELVRRCESARQDAELTADASLVLIRSLSDWTTRFGLGRTSDKENG